MIDTGTRSKGNVFQLNPTKITCFVAKVDNSQIWNISFCHIKFDNILKVNNTFVVRDFPKITKPTDIVCKECILAKQKKITFPSKKFATIEKLKLVHIDLIAPPRTRASYGERYFLILANDFTRMMWVDFL